MIEEGFNMSEQRLFSNYFKFSIINPKINNTFYYLRSFYDYKDLKNELNYEFMISQEQKFLQLICDSPQSDLLCVWSNFISWVKKVAPNDTLRIFSILDYFSQMTKDLILYKQDENIQLWLEYASVTNDEVDIYKYMLHKNIFLNDYDLIEKMVTYYCSKEEFQNAEKIIEKLSNADNSRRRLYEKIKLIIENKINEWISQTIIFPVVINNYLQRQLNDTGSTSSKNKCSNYALSTQDNYSADKENSSLSSNVNLTNTSYNNISKNDSLNTTQKKPNLQIINSKEYSSENERMVDLLIQKYFYIKQFLIKYDEDFYKTYIRFKNNNENIPFINLKVKNWQLPFSWLNKDRLHPKISVNLLINTLSYMRISDYYTKTINSYKLPIVKWAIDQTKTLPRSYKTEFETDSIEKDCFEYLFRVNILMFTKYDRDNYSTKLSLMQNINNNYHVRNLVINYAVKNLIYLHGVNEYYVGLFTPFYFILFDSKSMTFVYRHRFEINHFTEDNALIYLHSYHPHIVAFSISNVIYVTQIDFRNIINNKFKLEGQKDDVHKLFYKKIDSVNLLVSCSKSQIIIWDLETQNIQKIFAIDESKLLIKQLVLTNLQSLIITTVYNQMYILEFCEDNVIKNLKISNFKDDEYIYDYEYKGENPNNFIYRLNSKNLSLFDPLNEKVLLNIFDTNQNLKNCDLIFIRENMVFKKICKKNKIIVFRLV